MVEPVKKGKYGAIDYAVWENEREGKDGKFMSYSYQITKNFKRDENSDWEKTTIKCFSQDYENTKKCIEEVGEFLTEKKAKTKYEKKE